jgi:RimJ/RimL family protein N-acetyltransferase
MQIRLANMNDLQKMLSILNLATLDLQQKSINQWDYPWNINKIVNQIKNNCSYVLLDGDKIIGTFCITDIDHINELSVNVRSKYLSQIALLPKFQGRKFGSEITSYSCSFAKELNKTLYLDCWAGNEKLKEFYLKNGFNYIGDFPEGDYFISIFKYA